MYQKYRMGTVLQYITIFYMRSTKYRNSSTFLFKRLPQCGQFYGYYFSPVLTSDNHFSLTKKVHPQKN